MIPLALLLLVRGSPVCASDVVVTGNRNNRDISLAEARAVLALEDAIKDRRILVIHVDREGQRASQVDFSKAGSVVKGYVFENAVPDVACFKNPVLKWFISNGNQEISDGHYSIKLSSSNTSFAAVGFSFLPIGRDGVAYDASQPIFVYVDSLRRNASGSYVSTSGAIDELYTTTVVNNRAEMARIEGPKYICLSGPDEVDQQTRESLSRTKDRNIVWTKTLDDREYEQLDQIFTQNANSMFSINRAVLSVSGRNPASYGTMVLTSRPLTGGIGADRQHSWLGCLPEADIRDLSASLICGDGVRLGVFDPFGILTGLKEKVKKAKKSLGRLGEETFLGSNLPTANISSKPVGADVYVDEERQATPTNDTYGLPADEGPENVRVELQGYLTCNGKNMKSRKLSEMPAVYKIDCKMKKTKRKRR